MAAADEYREHWIEAQAAENSKTEVEGGGQPATRYKRIHSVPGSQPDGTEITLALQSRTSDHEGKTWNVVSWRTRLGPGGHNRRMRPNSRWFLDNSMQDVNVQQARALHAELRRITGTLDKGAKWT